MPSISTMLALAKSRSEEAKAKSEYMARMLAAVEAIAENTKQANALLDDIGQKLCDVESAICRN